METKEKLKKIRKEKGFTQVALSKILDISAKTYISYEQGVRKIPLPILERLSSLYGVPISYFVDEHAPNPSDGPDDIFIGFLLSDIETLTAEQRNAICTLTAVFVEDNKKLKDKGGK